MKLLALNIIFLVFLSLLSCQKELDPCIGVNCEYGTCVDGICACYVSHMGPNCNLQNPPSKLILRRVSFFDIPTTRLDSSTWDLDGTIDPYLIIKREGTEIYRTEYERDVLNFEFRTYTMYLRILQINSNYTISLIDDDLHEEEIISSFTFVPYSNDNGFPEQLELENDQGTKLLLTVMYDF